MKTFKSKLREVSAVYKKHHSIQDIKISSSNDVNLFVRKIYPVEINIREAMIVVFLNNSNRTLGYSIAGIGGITGTVVDVRLILRDALLTQSTSLILVHNHPSGNLKPSQADVSLTDKVKRAAMTMDIKLLDHLIITDDQFYSFADFGKL
jgi:DNA repair protein RadC